MLIDNNSKDRTVEICRDFKEKYPELNFKYILESKQGLSFARNRGLDEAKGELLVFIDDDACPEKEYVQNIIHFFDNTPDAVAAGGRIYPVFESKRPIWMSDILLSLVSVLDLGDKVCLFKKKYPIGANMIFRRDTIQKYGRFNVLLGRRGDNLEGAEEKELFLRIISSNGKVYYIPNVIVHHMIPDQRLSFDYFRRQALGVGYSEGVRVRNISFAVYLNSLFKEVLKWGVTVVLCFYYCLSFRFQKGWRLLIFRRYVSEGLLSKELKK